VLVNLIGNAIKFTEHGEVLLNVTAEGCADGHVILTCSVEDTGIGIPEKDQPKLFESFLQLDGSMTRSRGGSGLGLAITKQLVELMGGEIGFRSEVGRGSRFFFSVRMACSVIDETNKRLSQGFPDTFRVLAVDSNGASAGVLARYFASWKVQAEIVGTIDGAKSRWNEAANEQPPFDVAIIDVKGFGDAGIDMAQQIRNGHWGCPGNVVLLVGLGAMIADDRLANLGAVKTLFKPPRPSELYECLTNMAIDAGKLDVAPFSQRRAARGKRLSFDGRVLVAEDNLVNREVVTGILESMGLHVVTAPNGRVRCRPDGLRDADCGRSRSNATDAGMRIPAHPYQ
jgi:CheY-like chemotaxis protein